MLKKIIKEIKIKSFYINNIDINIITQTPKIKNHKVKIINNIARICEISKNQINLKGKQLRNLELLEKKKRLPAKL